MTPQTAGKVITKGKWQVTMTPDDIYRNPMDIAWSFDYLFGKGKVEDLYKRAKQNQWDADEHGRALTQGSVSAKSASHGNKL